MEEMIGTIRRRHPSGVEYKPWGAVRTVVETDGLILQRIAVLAGGCCSIHRHESRWNRFFVTSGRLLVEIWTPARVVAVVEKNGAVDVPPGLWHRFTALGVAEAWEAYWSRAGGTLSIEDIHRDPLHSVGGLLTREQAEHRRWHDDRT